MTKREWMREQAPAALTFLAVALFFGLATGARFPAVVTSNGTYYPRDYDENGEYRENTRCWGVPIVYWRCTTTMEPLTTEAASG